MSEKLFSNSNLTIELVGNYVKLTYTSGCNTLAETLMPAAQFIEIADQMRKESPQ